MIQASGFMLMIFSSETNPEAPGSSCEPILFAPTASTSPPQPLWPWVKQQASLLPASASTKTLAFGVMAAVFWRIDCSC